MGSINPSRLQSFEEAGRQFGIEETLTSPLDGKGYVGGWLGRIASLLPVVLVLAIMAILGNIALHTNPVDLQQPAGDTESSIVFSNFRPANGDIVGLGSREISVQIEAQSAVVSATLVLDDQTLDTQLSGSSPMTQTALATVQGLTLGLHTARVNAVVENGDRKSSQWRFRVSSNDDNGGIPSEGPQPTPGLPVTAALETGRFVPAVNGRVLADGGTSR